MRNSIDVRKLENTLSGLERLFRARDFVGLEQLTRSVRLSAVEIQKAITEYPEPVTGLNRTTLDVIEVQPSNVPRWSVNVRFLTKRGDSDLTLVLFLKESQGNSPQTYDAEIADIRAL